MLKDNIFTIFSTHARLATFCDGNCLSMPLNQRPKNSRIARPLLLPGRAATLSSQIVTEVREALFEKRLAPGKFLGTEKDLAERYGVSRMAARDALRTLEAMGIVDIKMGAGGGARIAHGNPRLFAEALAVQMELTGVTAPEIIDTQRAIESLAAELAAENATAADIAKLKQLLADAEHKIKDMDAFTRSSLEFHLAVAEASHNRALLFQLISLQHASWPMRNRTLTVPVAKRILAAHQELADLIEVHDPGTARRLMDEHVRMIRARRVAERGERGPAKQICC